MLVDKDLKSNYDRIELEEMVQVALLCTQYLPGHRPKMSEVVRMLEGDGLAERWEASQRVDTTKFKPQESSSSDRYSDLTDDSLLLVQAMELSGPRWINCPVAAVHFHFCFKGVQRKHMIVESLLQEDYNVVW